MTSAPPPDDAGGSGTPDPLPGPEIGPETGSDPTSSLLLRDQSGTQAMVGYTVDLRAGDGRARVFLDITEKHSNRNGMLHGGLMAVLMDAACGFTASMSFDDSVHPLQVPVVTVSLTLNHVGGARLGQRVIATGQATGGGRKITHVTGQLRDEDGALVATTSGVFRRISG